MIKSLVFSIMLVSSLMFSCSNGSNSSSDNQEQVLEEIATESASEEMEGETPTEAAAVEEESNSISKSDLKYMDDLLAELPTIGRYAVGSDHHMLASILEHIGNKEEAEKVKGIIEQVGDNHYYYDIKEWDPSNGYIEFIPLGSEATYTMVYWNQSNGEKLIGTEIVGCGPVCEAELSFRRDNGKEIVEVPFNKVVLYFEPEAIIPVEANETDVWENRFHLPQKGKDIRYCVHGIAECIVLKWDDGKFLAQAPK